MKEKIESMFKEEGLDFSGTVLFIPASYLEGARKGTFFPRKGYGLVKYSEKEIEDWIVYTHEYAHGAFFENVKLGKQLKKLEKDVYRWEQELFDRSDSAQLLVGNTNRELEEEIASQHLHYDPNKDRYFMVTRESMRGYLQKKKKLDEVSRECKEEVEQFAQEWESKLLERLQEDRLQEPESYRYQ